MSSSSQPRFSYLRRKVREWKLGDLLHPGAQSMERFRRIAPSHLLPIVTDLQQALEAEGLRATVRDMSEEMGFLTLTIDDFDIELSFWPHEHPHAFRMFTCRRAEPEHDSTRLLAYRDLESDTSPVIEMIEESILRALGPRRASEEEESSEPTTFNC